MIACAEERANLPGWERSTARPQQRSQRVESKINRQTHKERRRKKKRLTLKVRITKTMLYFGNKNEEN